MEKVTRNQSPTADREIAAVRVLNAPRELVFDCWTKPEHIVKWWGPTGFTTTIQQMEVKPGGIWQLVMHGPDGTDYPNRIKYLEVTRPKRLVYSHGSGVENDSLEFHVTVDFEDLGGKTKLTMCMLFATAEERNHVAEKYGAVEGLTQTLDRLEGLLATY